MEAHVLEPGLGVRLPQRVLDVAAVGGAEHRVRVIGGDGLFVEAVPRSHGGADVDGERHVGRGGGARRGRGGAGGRRRGRGPGLRVGAGADDVVTGGATRATCAACPAGGRATRASEAAAVGRALRAGRHPSRREGGREHDGEAPPVDGRMFQKLVPHLWFSGMCELLPRSPVVSNVQGPPGPENPELGTIPRPGALTRIIGVE